MVIVRPILADSLFIPINTFTNKISNCALIYLKVALRFFSQWGVSGFWGIMLYVSCVRGCFLLPVWTTNNWYLVLGGNDHTASWSEVTTNSSGKLAAFAPSSSLRPRPPGDAYILPGTLVH